MLRIVGAGLGRTGTSSLKQALEQLLGAPCYHMAEVFAHPEHIPSWLSAARGSMPDWQVLFRGYAATVDWPGAAFWREISAAFPEAKVLLSVRDSESWWRSASTTIFPASQNVPPGAWREMVDAMFANRFTADLGDRDLAIAAFERHNALVRQEVEPGRLVEWTASDGWGPLCAALNLRVPAEPFPHLNTTDDFLAMHR